MVVWFLCVVFIGMKVFAVPVVTVVVEVDVTGSAFVTKVEGIV